MRVVFLPTGRAHYLHWCRTDPAMLERVNTIIEDTRHSPHTGLGKPEPLRGQLSGYWSRRINQEHRLVYRVEGRAGEDPRVIILQCRYHY